MKALLAATRGLTFRLSIALMLWFAVSVAIMLGIAYILGVANPTAQMESRIAGEASSLARLYRSGGDTTPLVRALHARAAKPGDYRAYHVFRDAKGGIISTNLPLMPPKAGRPWMNFAFDIYPDEGAERPHQVLARTVKFPDGARLLVGRDTEVIAAREEFIQEAFGWGGGLTLILGLIGGLFISAAVGKRIENISRIAERIRAGDLSGRIEVLGNGDDFDLLAQVLNKMLEKNEEMFQAITRVSDSVSHELRTPLARLHADLDKLKSQLHASPELRQTLISQAVDDAVRLQETFDALLRITRIETGRHALDAQPVDLTSLLEDAAELYAPSADQKRQRFHRKIESGLVVTGDRHLLFQAVTNLIDNALKFTPEGGAITVQAWRDEGSAVLTVTDNGQGVSEGDLPHLAERFYRSAEHADTDGLGLGLALVATVIKRHRGKLHLQNNAPGFSATVKLAAGH